ncbi:AMP-dependent synthetase [Marinosulfonomonas sp. PRT-SC04]|nr:AMP-dependent synthetase [Marinosulfonomonas sp. PRT-SC04]
MLNRVITPDPDWDVMRRNFRWDLPAEYNIAIQCCRRWAVQFPDRVALIHLSGNGDEQPWTYGMLERASNRLANAFAARGLQRGDRVGILLQQGPEVLICHFAAYKLGAIALPLFTLFGEDALAYRLSDSGARIVVTDGANLAKVMSLRDQLPDLSEVYSIDAATAPTRDFHGEIAAGSDQITPVVTKPDDPALLIYTSGTTGPPKGVLHGHQVMLGHLPAIEMHHEFFPQKGDRGWTPADWAWIGGLMDMAMPCLYYGVPLVSRRMRKFDPDEAYALMAKHHLRNLFMPPTALKLMQQAVVPAGVNLRSVSSGGESLGAPLLAWAQDALGCHINEIYGQTECNLVISSQGGGGHQVAGAMGRAVPGHEVAVIDAQGQVLPAGEIGEIAVRRPDPVMFLRYWNKAEDTAAKFIGDWMRTGDLGTCDAAGYFTFSSRDDDVITSAGYRIGPSEIEHCLGGHPDVVMAAVIGVPDALRTEVVKAFVVLRDGVDWEGLEAVLIQRVRDKVSPHVAPRMIVPIDSLPMTATGKIMRRELRGK